jgi:chorismate lyase / 3-hydroxybenzoate synthase
MLLPPAIQTVGCPVSMPGTAEKLTGHSSFEVEFGREAAEIVRVEGRTVLRLPLPWLGGDPTESLFQDARPAGEAHGFHLHEAGDLLVGCAVRPVGGAPERAARELYRGLLAACAGRPLCRIWNYVPAINEQPGGLENYRAFCAGRSLAFEAAHGTGFRRTLPAASAVGCGGDSLAAVFVACRTAPRHVENPEQVAAYEYPPEHGVRPPSFSRATITSHAGRPLVFVSGTAAIKGHATVAPHSLVEQLECTFDNLRIIGRAAGLGETLGAGPWSSRHFKAYVRHAGDLPAVRARLERDLVRPEDRVIYLRADMCRAALDVEIEATLLG